MALYVFGIQDKKVEYSRVVDSLKMVVGGPSLLLLYCSSDYRIVLYKCNFIFLW